LDKWLGLLIHGLVALSLLARNLRRAAILVEEAVEVADEIFEEKEKKEEEEAENPEDVVVIKRNAEVSMRRN
jgi:hypothetical protein